MTIEEALTTANIDRLDAEVLLAFLVGESREWLITHPDTEVDENAWIDLCKRRLQSEPIAYITHTKEFYGRDFFVDHRVLIPRPSTEVLIDQVLSFMKDPRDDIRTLDTDVVGVSKIFGELTGDEILVDLCTGTGCIAITLALETYKKVIATDISNDALDVARINIKKYDLEQRIDFAQGDLTDPLTSIDQPFIVITNPPYIPENEELMDDVVRFEPHLALFSGPDGSNSVVKIYNSLKVLPMCKGLIMECKKDHVKLIDF